jgi:hypothetical protein
MDQKVVNFDEMVVNTNVCWAVAQNVSRHTVAFMDLERPLERMASGVLVTIGGHLFVATAAHAISSQPGEQLSFVLPKTKAVVAGTLPILRRGKIESEWPDVGFLELDPEGALSALGKAAIDLQRIRLLGPGDPKRPCFLFGYPPDVLQAKQADTSEPHPTIRPMCYSDAPISPDNWPNVPSADPPSKQALDIFLPYDPGEDHWYCEKNEGHETVPEPRWTKGGGLWQGFGGETQFGRAENVQLFGIQSRWSEKRKYLRACQIIHWLQLLHEKYSDLRSALVEAFPELA